ncbi:hypothetical protein HPB49_011800 [Dermacentor silvarum]|uniref:Uncharacterized protein n=1 Tax=Dermacentor silvarum TaxID=543639 RepID=A0ACB8CF49_DERSI|nr:hypothetical protein HPB49_011800 [Dermacentor silvarum]
MFIESYGANGAAVKRISSTTESVLGLIRRIANSHRQGESQETRRGCVVGGRCERKKGTSLVDMAVSAEDRTIAHLSGIGRSTVNIVYREFCQAVVDIHEGTWVRMARKEEMAEQMRELHAVTGFRRPWAH